MTTGEPLSPQSRPVLAASVRFRTDPISGEPVLLFPEGLLVLSETAAAIVERCDGKNSIAQILAQIEEEYAVEPSELERDVRECLRDLSRRTLLHFLP